MIKKISIIIMTLTIALCSLSCTAGNNAEKNVTESLTTSSARQTTETTTELTTEKTTTERSTELTIEVIETTAEEMQTTKKEVVTTTKKAPVTTTKKAIVTSPDGKNLGSFKITVYTPGSDGGVWGYQTATGVRSQHLSTCAVDPDVIPLGSTIKVGDLTLLACDTGSAVRGNVIDIFYDGSDGEACEWVSNFGTYHDVQKL